MHVVEDGTQLDCRAEGPTMLGAGDLEKPRRAGESQVNTAGCICQE